MDEYLELVRDMYGERDFSMEQALSALQFHNYDVQAAMFQMFLSPLPAHNLVDAWPLEQQELFDRLVKKYGKDFHAVAEQIGRPTTECVEMYYTRKNQHAFVKNVKQSALSARGTPLCLSLGVRSVGLSVGRSLCLPNKLVAADLTTHTAVCSGAECRGGGDGKLAERLARRQWDAAVSSNGSTPIPTPTPASASTSTPTSALAPTPAPPPSILGKRKELDSTEEVAPVS